MKFLSVLNLIITVQAVFLSLHFFLKTKSEKLLNRLLSLLCFAFAMISLNTYLSLDNIQIGNSVIQDVANNVMWFIGPSIFLYTTHKDQTISRRIVLLNILPYCIPAAINLFFSWNWFDRIIPIVAFMQMCVYLFFSVKYILTSYSRSSNFYHWILPSILAFSVLVLINFGLTILRLNNIQLISSEVQQSFTSVLVIPIFFLAYKEMNSTNDFGIKPKKYQSIHLSDEEVKINMKKVDAIMKEDQPYLSKELTLEKFAQQINIKSKYISQAINQEQGISFSEYILQFRLNHVKEKLVDPTNKHLTIFGIAQESGFNSNSRFSHLFKKHTGLTAKQYQQKYS